MVKIYSRDHISKVVENMAVIFGVNQSLNSEQQLAKIICLDKQDFMNRPWRFYDIDPLPVTLEYLLPEELKANSIYFDGTP